MKAKRLRQLFAGDRTMSVLGVNDAIGAVIAERHGFDALWASGLGISTAWGVPDAGILVMTEMLQAAIAADRACSLPVISDCDTGFGDILNVRRMVTDYEAAGIAAVCIEDKDFPKRNSFRGKQKLADPYEFAVRLAAAADARQDPDFAIIARVESLIAGLGLDEAVRRAELYTTAGADAILMHSKKRTPEEILDFAARWNDLGRPVPLIVVPTTYPDVTIQQLHQAGVAAVIYANQALRATVRAVEETVATIKRKGSSAELEPTIASLSEVFDLTGTEQDERIEERYAAEVARLRDRHGNGRAAQGARRAGKPAIQSAAR